MGGLRQLQRCGPDRAHRRTVVVSDGYGNGRRRIPLVREPIPDPAVRLLYDPIPQRRIGSLRQGSHRRRGWVELPFCSTLALAGLCD